MITQQLTAEEMLESLTGHEEIAIGKAFGAEVLDLAETKPTTYIRALIFVAQKRQGFTDADAKKGALDLTIRQAQEYFAEDEDEPVVDEPVTEPGKGSAQPA